MAFFKAMLFIINPLPKLNHIYWIIINLSKIIHLFIVIFLNRVALTIVFNLFN